MTPLENLKGYYQDLEKDAKEKGFDNRADKMGFERYPNYYILDYMVMYNTLTNSRKYSKSDFKKYSGITSDKKINQIIKEMNISNIKETLRKERN